MHSFSNKRILITRARHQASELALLLESLGATPIPVPTIEIVPPETYAPLDAALARLGTFDWLLFTSANAVDVFHQRRAFHTPAPSAPCADSRTWVSAAAQFPRIAVIGPATARAVQGIGLHVDLVPPQHIAESLAAELTPYAANSRMLIVRAAEARDILPEALRAAKATVTIAEAYRNQIPSGSISALQSIFTSPKAYPDAITFTSASTARNLFTLLEAANIILPEKIIRASIGPITSQTLRDLGHPPHIEAAEPTIPALVQTLMAHFTS